MTENKLTIRKQLLGALMGAAMALVLYQGYAFTSSRLQAALWPTKTLSGEVYNRSSSSPRYIDPHFVARTSSYIAPAAAALARKKAQSSSFGSPDYIGTSDAAMNEQAQPTSIPEELLQIDAPLPEDNSYADSLSSDAGVPSGKPLQNDTQFVASNVSAHGDKLPQSGFGLDLVAFAALGAVMGSRKARRKTMQSKNRGRALLR